MLSGKTLEDVGDAVSGAGTLTLRNMLSGKTLEDRQPSFAAIARGSPKARKTERRGQTNPPQSMHTKEAPSEATMSFSLGTMACGVIPKAEGLAHGSVR